MKKKIAVSIGCLVMAGMAGCAYAPDDDDDSGTWGRMWESAEYALAPNTRWTCLYYYEYGAPWAPVLYMKIFPDSHRIQFIQYKDGEAAYDQHPTINHDRIVTEEKWNWIAGQLEQAGVVRWKTFYELASSMTDGTQWGIRFLDGSNVVGKVEGYSAWPKNFKAFEAIMDSFGTEEKAASPR